MHESQWRSGGAGRQRVCCRGRAETSCQTCTGQLCSSSWRIWWRSSWLKPAFLYSKWGLKIVSLNLGIGREEEVGIKARATYHQVPTGTVGGGEHTGTTQNVWLCRLLHADFREVLPVKNALGLGPLVFKLRQRGNHFWKRHFLPYSLWVALTETKFVCLFVWTQHITSIKLEKGNLLYVSIFATKPRCAPNTAV